MRLRSHLPLLTLLAGSIALTSAAHADEAADLKALVEKQSSALVTVKAVMKMDYGQGARTGGESRITLQGVNVHPSGLIMLTNMLFSPKRTMEVMGGKEAAQAYANIKATASSIKVTFPGDEKEYDGFVGATDTNLDLLFIKVEKPPANMPVVQFSSAVAPSVGQEVVMVARLSSGYDSAPYFQTARIAGEITKPRRAWVMDGSLAQFGLPVFTSKGDVIGVLTTIPAGASDEGAADAMGMAMLMRMMGGSGGAAGGAFIVPGSAVQAVIDQAVIRAEAVATERAKKKADPGTKAPVKKPTTP
jgi:hypothetical protein